MKEEKQCKAKIVLGSFLCKTWAQCKIRYNGTCCKDCRVFPCRIPCSKLLDSKEEEFKCPYYLTSIEAVFKRLERNSE